MASLILSSPLLSSRRPRPCPFFFLGPCIVDVLDGALDLLLEPVLVVGRLGVVPLDTEGVVKQGGELLGFHLLHKYKRCYFDKSSSPVSTNSNLLK